jgi:hypothetical protein
MIWNKLSILRAVFPSRSAARDVARRWHAAASKSPQLATDLIVLGGVLTMQPIDNGEVDITNPHRLAYEAGRRDMALQLLAMMNLSIEDLNTLTEQNDA